MNEHRLNRLTDTPAAVASHGRAVLKALVRPGAKLMGRARLSVKLSLLVAVLSVPICILLGTTMSAHIKQRDVARSALEAMPITQALIDTFGTAQRLRDVHIQVSAGDTTLEGARQEERQRLQKALSTANQRIRAARLLELNKVWTPVNRQLEALSQGVHNEDALGAQAEFSGALNDVHRLLHVIAQMAGTADGDDAQARELTSILVDGALHVAEIAGELRSQGAAMLHDKARATLRERSIALGLAIGLERQVTQLLSTMEALSRTGMPMPGAWKQSYEASLRLARDSQDRFGAETLEGSAAAHFDASSAAVDFSLAVMRESANRLEGRMRERLANKDRDIRALGAASLAGSIFILYIVWSFYVSFHHSMREVLRGMKATAQGDMSRRMRVRGSDEMAAIAQSFDLMSEKLSGTVADIRSRAARVDNAGRQVAAGSQSLANRTEEQAHSVRSTAAAIGQISSAVSQNAQAAREVDSLTERLFAQAEEGNAAMAETVVAMDELQNASAKVTDVVAVIDDVAFQTGMLALNAAVEAARAGVAGKGFAVVAGEVRQLAMRCAESADEIRQLITASGLQVQDSSEKLQHVSVALDTLVNGVREVSGQLRVIATASTQQSAALEEVEANISALEGITRDNASLVEESNASSNALLAQGDALTASVASMRLRHGSADEARMLVERALVHAKAVGRTQALTDFNTPDSEWVDRDLFLFCFDRLGNIVANGARPERIGTNVNSLDGLRGTHHSDRLWDCVENGGGWVYYELLNPATQQITPKESWVMPLDDQTLIGCGCYGKPREADPAQQMPAGPVAWSRASETSSRVAA